MNKYETIISMKAEENMTLVAETTVFNIHAKTKRLKEVAENKKSNLNKTLKKLGLSFDDVDIEVGRIGRSQHSATELLIFANSKASK